MKLFDLVYFIRILIGASLSPSRIVIGICKFTGWWIFYGCRKLFGNKDLELIHTRERKREGWETDNRIDEEKQEIRDIYSKKGFKEDLIEEIVRIITSRRKVWIDTMMKEELGLIAVLTLARK